MKFARTGAISGIGASVVGRATRRQLVVLGRGAVTGVQVVDLEPGRRADRAASAVRDVGAVVAVTREDALPLHTPRTRTPAVRSTTPGPCRLWREVAHHHSLDVTLDALARSAKNADRAARRLAARCTLPSRAPLLALQPLWTTRNIDGSVAIARSA